MQAEFPDIEIAVNDQPRGFAANHNAVLHRARTEFVALLNDDVILHQGALDTLINYLKDHPNVGLVGPALQNPDGSSQVSAYSDPSLFRTIYKVTGLASLTHQQSHLRKWLGRLGIFSLLNVESLKTHAGTRPVPVIKGTVMAVRQVAYQRQA
jgi:GT2 family glycosyltransferase